MISEIFDVSLEKSVTCLPSLEVIALFSEQLFAKYNWSVANSTTKVLWEKLWVGLRPGLFRNS
jgi:hypothetical protein